MEKREGEGTREKDRSAERIYIACVSYVSR